VCSLDQQPLALVASPSDPAESSGSESSKGWPPQVVVPAIAWLIVNFLLVGFFFRRGEFLVQYSKTHDSLGFCSKRKKR
jgi:hypothetical protein